MDVEKVKQLLSDKEKEGMKVDIAVSKAADFVFENGVAVEKPEEEAPAEEAAEAPEEEKAGEDKAE